MGRSIRVIVDAMSCRPRSPKRQRVQRNLQELSSWNPDLDCSFKRAMVISCRFSCKLVLRLAGPVGGSWDLEKPVAHDLFSTMSYSWDVVACCFGLLGFAGSCNRA